MRKKKINLWKDSLSYLKESQDYIAIVVLLFFASSLVTFIIPGKFVFFNEFLKDIVSRTEGFGTFRLILFIFQNNITSAFASMIFGLALGIFPIFNIIFNGGILGYVAALTTDKFGFFSLWRILPHGIFELPAIFISIGLGIRLGTFIFSRKKRKLDELKYRFWSSMKVFFTIVLPLLVIAAIIEGLLIGLSR